MPIPLNNFFIGKKLREISSYNNSSMDLLDDAVPVLVLNPSNGAAEVQPSFPKPNANQVLKYITFEVGTTAYAVQIATPSASKNYYYVGAQGYGNGTAAWGGHIFDATSGNGPSLSVDNSYADQLGYISSLNFTATNGDKAQYNPPVPIKVRDGLRGYMAAGASTGGRIIVCYIEESVFTP
jgi:hypothetical protein